MTDLTLGLALLVTVGLCCLLLGRFWRDKTTPPAAGVIADPAEIARLELEWLAKADQPPTVLPERVSSVALPGTVPPAPAVIGAIVDPPAPDTPPKHVELPDTGRHHRSFDHSGVQDTRKVFLRRTHLEKTT